MRRFAILFSLFATFALGLLMNMLANSAAYSQTASVYVPVGVSTGVGALSTAWFLDPAANRVIMCTGTGGRTPECTAAPIP